MDGLQVIFEISASAEYARIGSSTGLGTITLISAATSPYIGAFYVQKSTGNTGDIVGNIKIDNDYFYVCTGNYDGVTAIWKRTPIGAY